MQRTIQFMRQSLKIHSNTLKYNATYNTAETPIFHMIKQPAQMQSNTMQRTIRFMRQSIIRFAQVH